MAVGGSIAGAVPEEGRGANGSVEVLVLEPDKSTWGIPDLAELWEYRELLYFLIWRDIKVRYKQTALGASWAVIQPFFIMVVFSLFFGRLAGVPSDGVPYPIFAFAALVPWTFFATGLQKASNSLVASQSLIKKIYFPRLAIPVAAVVSGIVDLAIAFMVLIGMMLFFGMAITTKILVLPFLVILAILTALGAALWLSALNVRYRDVGLAVGFLIQLWLFATPIAYPSSLLPEPWRTLYGINPMAGVVEGFRWALLGVETAPGPMVLVSAGVTILLLLGGAVYFRRMERSFADIV
jgi:lipopolysaccharide transport system permease protein